MAAPKSVNPRFLAGVKDEPTQMLKPITGYDREPLLPIEEACKPLEDILDSELKPNIFTAKKNAKKLEHGLTVDEAAAIHLYTMEWDERENSLYAVLNRALREADRGKLRPWFKYLKLLLTGLHKIPSNEHQTVWRGIPEDLSSRYTKGEETTWWGLSSCTSAISVLESPTYVGTTGPRTMFSIETKTGKSIRDMSYFQKEDEILLLPGRYLKVVDKSSLGTGLHIIHLREVEPPYPMISDPINQSQPKRNPSEPTLPRQPTTEKKVEAFVPSDTKEQLDCMGHACAKCGYCRDWVYIGDAATWKWVQNWESWDGKDWSRWNNDNIYRRFQKRNGAGCLYAHPHFGCVCADNAQV